MEHEVPSAAPVLLQALHEQLQRGHRANERDKLLKNNSTTNCRPCAQHTSSHLSKEQSRPPWKHYVKARSSSEAMQAEPVWDPPCSTTCDRRS